MRVQLKWEKLHKTDPYPDGHALVKDGHNIYFGQFAENTFFVTENELEDWIFDFTYSKTYHVIFLELLP